MAHLPTYPQPPQKKSHKMWWVGGGVAVLLVLVCVIGSIAMLGKAADDALDKPLPGEVRVTASHAQKAPSQTPALLPNYKPKPSDFQLTVKVLTKHCFGSAGCNITYRVDVTYIGTSLPSAEDTWNVTYAVSGVEDGPQINTFELVGDQVTTDEELFAETKNSKVKLTAKVTDVLAG